MSTMYIPTIEAISKVLTGLLGVALYGFDLVVDPLSGRLAIVDINYFPSYRGCLSASEFFSHVAEFASSTLHK